MFIWHYFKTKSIVKHKREKGGVWLKVRVYEGWMWERGLLYSSVLYTVYSIPKPSLFSCSVKRRKKDWFYCPIKRTVKKVVAKVKKCGILYAVNIIFFTALNSVQKGLLWKRN